MTRIEMYNKARRLAYEQVDSCSSLNDAEYAEYQKMPEEKALKFLAREFLEAAVDYNFGE